MKIVEREEAAERREQEAERRRWRRVQYRRDHFTKYAVSYGAGVVFALAAVVAAFVTSWQTAGVLGGFAVVFILWARPERSGLARAGTVLRRPRRRRPSSTRRTC